MQRHKFKKIWTFFDFSIKGKKAYKMLEKNILSNMRYLIDL